MRTHAPMWRVDSFCFIFSKWQSNCKTHSCWLANHITLCRLPHCRRESIIKCSLVWSVCFTSIFTPHLGVTLHDGQQHTVQGQQPCAMSQSCRSIQSLRLNDLIILPSEWMWEEGGCREKESEHRKREMEVRWSEGGREIPEPAVAQRNVFAINLKHRAGRGQRPRQWGR